MAGQRTATGGPLSVEVGDAHVRVKRWQLDGARSGASGPEKVARMLSFFGSGVDEVRLARLVEKPRCQLCLDL